MEPKDLNFAAIPQTAINVVTKPAEFFQDMPKAGGYLEPLVFAAAMGLVSGVIYAVLALVGLGQTAHSGGVMTALTMIIFVPIVTAIFSFVGGAILFIIWKVMGSTEDYEAAYRCGAYLMALSPITAILGAIPYAGAVISAAIMVYYLVMASIHVHNLEAQKAWLVFGIIALIFTLLSVYGQYKARHLSPEAEKWREIGEEMQKEYGKSAEEMQKSADELRKQAEEMARKYREQQQSE